jgi:hypothetical protein
MKMDFEDFFSRSNPIMSRELLKETVIRFSEIDANASICTYNPALMERIESFGIKPHKKDGHGKIYIVPKSWFDYDRIGNPEETKEETEQRKKRKARQSGTDKDKQLKPLF